MSVIGWLVVNGILVAISVALLVLVWRGTANLGRRGASALPAQHRHEVISLGAHRAGQYARTVKSGRRHLPA
jgi:hypothetical protein